MTPKLHVISLEAGDTVLLLNCDGSKDHRGMRIEAGMETSAFDYDVLTDEQLKVELHNASET